jgi:hypothetical protein
LSVNDADDAANSTSYGGVGNRSVLYFSIVPYNVSATQSQVAHGIWFSSGTPGRTNINYGSAVSFAVNTQTYSALDTRGAIAPTGSGNPVNALTMTAGQVIDFNGGANLNSAPGRYLQYVSGDTALEYLVSGTKMISLTDTGGVIASSYNAPLTTPASSSAACTAGRIEWDAGFIYICTATNVWKRAALSTF